MGPLTLRGLGGHCWPKSEYFLRNLSLLSTPQTKVSSKSQKVSFQGAFKVFLRCSKSAFKVLSTQTELQSDLKLSSNEAFNVLSGCFPSVSFRAELQNKRKLSSKSAFEVLSRSLESAFKVSLRSTPKTLLVPRGIWSPFLRNMGHLRMTGFGRKIWGSLGDTVGRKMSIFCKTWPFRQKMGIFF